MKYPALDLGGVLDPDLLLAFLDDFSPSAVTDHETFRTIYFTRATDRDRAVVAIAQTFPQATTRAHEVDDEDWARRSQESLAPVTVGRIVVTPPWHVSSPPTTPAPLSRTGGGAPPPPRTYADASLRISMSSARHGRRRSPLTLVIAPSMGFGTGHHATTRLCLAALQRINLEGRVVLDIGTGSGVLAIAARLLGAREALGIDNDADAIQAARENLDLNRAVTGVRFEVVDLRDASFRPAEIVTANLTGALLTRTAPLLRATVRPGGTLVLSGLLTGEREAVVRALEPARLLWEDAEDGWVVLVFRL